MPLEIVAHHPLKSLNTFGIPAFAAHYAHCRSLLELREALAWAQSRALPLLVLGGGSNLLLTGDFDGLVLHMGIEGEEIVAEDAETLTLRVGAGEEWHGLVMRCVERGWGGIENLSLIPGCLGAAPIQNIGAYGVELKDVFAFLDAQPVSGGESKRFDAAECAFGYRDSVFKRDLKGQYVITHVALHLRKTAHRIDTSYGAIADELRAVGIEPASATIRDVSAAVIRIRQSKLPDPKVVGNAGSFFKNPEIPTLQFNALKSEYPQIPGYVVSDTVMKVPAAWLIEQAGWKGQRFGEHGVHDKQALVLVNYGAARGSDILALSERIQGSVADKFGVQLEREVNVV